MPEKEETSAAQTAGDATTASDAGIEKAEPTTAIKRWPLQGKPPAPESVDTQAAADAESAAATQMIPWQQRGQSARPGMQGPGWGGAAQGQTPGQAPGQAPWQRWNTSGGAPPLSSRAGLSRAADSRDNGRSLAASGPGKPGCKAAARAGRPAPVRRWAAREWPVRE